VVGVAIDEKSFVPAALKNPRREFETDKQRCIAHALSFFTTAESAIARYCQLKEGHSRIGKAIGDHLAKGPIERKDGTATAEENGHFSFFEEEGCNFFARFQVVRELPQ
jgi:hypothetical protein